MLPSAKVGIYKPSGTGRDGYITVDNGGFCIKHPSRYQPHYTKTNGLYYSKLGTGSHTTIYQRDGTGRDTGSLIKIYTHSRKKITLILEKNYTKIWINSRKFVIGSFRKLNKNICKHLSNYNISD